MMGFKPRPIPRMTARQIEQRVDEWLEEIRDKQPLPQIKVSVIRTKGVKHEIGTLGTYGHLPSIEEIKKEYGPGKYRLRVMTLRENHTYIYAGNATVTIK